MEHNEALKILRKHENEFAAYQRVEEALVASIDASKHRVDEQKRRDVLLKENRAIELEGRGLSKSLEEARVSTATSIKELEDKLSRTVADVDRKLTGEEHRLDIALGELKSSHELQIRKIEAEEKETDQKRKALQTDIASLEKRMGELKNIVSQMAGA